MIIVKSPREIELMREAGRITASVFDALEPLIKPGITTRELDRVAEETIRAQGATPGFKGYGDFPFTICASVNDVLVHGFANSKPLKEGDSPVCWRVEATDTISMPGVLEITAYEYYINE